LTFPGLKLKSTLDWTWELVSEKLAEVAPAAAAVTAKAPAIPLAVAVTFAAPAAPVFTELLDKVTLAPAVGAANVTITPLTGLP
jgi:hypothetical protein